MLYSLFSRGQRPSPVEIDILKDTAAKRANSFTAVNTPNSAIGFVAVLQILVEGFGLSGVTLAAQLFPEDGEMRQADQARRVLGSGRSTEGRAICPPIEPSPSIHRRAIRASETRRSGTERFRGELAAPLRRRQFVDHRPRVQGTDARKTSTGSVSPTSVS